MNHPDNYKEAYEQMVGAACDPIQFDGDMVKSLAEAANAWNRRAT